jgi:MFS family permease
MLHQAVSDADDDGRLHDPGLVAFILLAVGTLSIAFSVIAPLLGPIAAEFGGEAAAQQIVVAPLAGFAVGGLLGGWIIAALGVRRTILAATVAYILTGASGLYAQSAGVLQINAFLLGAASVVILTAGGVVLADRYRGNARARLLGYQTAAGSLLNAAAVFLSGVIAEAVGWRMSFLLFVGLGLVVLVVAALYVPKIAAAPKSESKAGFVAYAPLIPIFVSVAAYLLVTTNTVTHTSLLLADAGVKSTTIAATIISLQGLSAMATGFFYGRMAASMGRLAVLGGGVAVCALGFILPGVFHNVYAFGAGTLALGASVGMVIPFLTERLMGMSSEQIRPQALGYFATAQFAGGFFNPFVIGPVREALGLHGMYIATGVFTALVGLAGVMFLATRKPAAA